MGLFTVYSYLLISKEERAAFTRLVVAQESQAASLKALLEKLNEPPGEPHDLGALAEALRKKDDEVQAALDTAPSA